MTKRKTKRGRKKLLSNYPTNLNCWRFVLRNDKYVNQFISRGNKEQKRQIIRVLNYLKRFEPDEFTLLDGERLLIKFKENEE